MKLAVFALLLVVLPFQAEAKPNVCDTLIVKVYGADDILGDGSLNAPDGYAKVMVDGQTKKTRVIHDSYYPRWRQEFKFTNIKSDMLVIEVWDYDDFFHGGDDLVGTYRKKIKLGSYRFYQYYGTVTFDYHCLKGNMKRKKLE